MNSKLVSLKKARSIRDRLGSQGKMVIFTNGCFDIVHAGHVLFLRRARKLGDFLIVGLNKDASVKRLKGKGRPIIPFRDRVAILSALEPVDLIVGFDSDTPLDLINKLKPDILAKGADYKLSEIVGAREVKGWGGTVRRIRLLKGKSTSQLIKRLETGKV